MSLQECPVCAGTNFTLGGVTTGGSMFFTPAPDPQASMPGGGVTVTAVACRTCGVIFFQCDPNQLPQNLDSASKAVRPNSASEKELDLAFATAILNSKEFCDWLVRQTRFANVAEQARLLCEEQIAARPRVGSQFWYRHWCKLPDGSESETDIMLIFEDVSANERFALHIENKPPRGKFTKDQEKNYAHRAEFMSNKPQYLNYSNWETILIAPEAFRQSNSDRCAAFQRFISYEDTARFVPEFGFALREAGVSCP